MRAKKSDESFPYRLLHQAREHPDGSPTSVAMLVEADASTGAGHDRIRQRVDISTRRELDCKPLSPLQHVVLDEYTTRISSFSSPVPIAEPSFFAVEQAPPVESMVDIRFLNEECLMRAGFCWIGPCIPCLVQEDGTPVHAPSVRKSVPGGSINS